MATQPTQLIENAGYWTTRWYDDNNTRRMKRFGKSSTVRKTEARKSFNNWLVQWNNDATIRTPSDEGQYTIKKLAEVYDEFAQGYYRKPDGRLTGEAQNLHDSFKPAVEIYGDLPARDFTPSKLKAVREMMIGKGYVRTSINQRINRIRRIFKWAVSEEIIPAHVLTGLQAVPSLSRGRSEASESDKVTPVAFEIVEATRAFLSSPVRAMVDLQWLTGMRSGEVTSMRGCDIEMNGNVWMYRPTTHKTEHHGIVRTIPLGPQAQDIIRQFLKIDTSANLFSPRDAEEERRGASTTHRRKNQKPTQRLSERSLGDTYSPATYYRAIQYACDNTFPAPDVVKGKALIEWRKENRWGPHQLRHACATRLRKEYGLEASRVVLGHTKADTTEMYAEIDHAKSVQIMAEVG